MRKLIFGILVAFGFVSVSFGVDLYGNEENYQKLKAEVEVMVKSVEKSGNIVIDEDSCNSRRFERHSELVTLCYVKNVLAFFDELRAMEVENDDLLLAIAKVREMPRFKEDSGIYSYMDETYKNRAIFKDKAFWKRVFEDWKWAKIEFGISDATIEVWKQAGEIGRIE